MLVRCSGSGDTDKARATRNEMRLADRFRELIDRHYRQDWQVQDYASVLGVSLAQLRAACVAATGQHPIKIVHSCIITEAKRNLIFGEMSVEQVAYWLGFSDPAYFTRFFKKEVGKTPSGVPQEQPGIALTAASHSLQPAPRLRASTPTSAAQRAHHPVVTKVQVNLSKLHGG
ncbi:MAG: Transcriptional activator of 4-hydroxyphenylacetate 3-monooxygenase operon, XylS/AraC family [Gammaproteobacteria bacterium]|nr:Transcriptional activator of 4-hydroxyphenylacetate 3-monooxygenase operon, XylS/AraC family [Gammaproteobacteria bacterium]